MKLAKPIEFIKAKPEDVIKHLETVKRETVKVAPSSLRLKTGTGNDAEKVYLMISNGKATLHEVREAFIMKLLKWYSFPLHVIPRLSTETIVSVGNDFLLNIKSSYVSIKLENDEALTIMSNRYTDIPDIEILEKCDKMGFKEVSRNDFFMSINSKEVFKTEAVPGDDCGFGYNVFNSETGFGALKISHFILRYICSNGAMVGINNDDFKPLVHYNISREEVFRYIDNSIKELSIKRTEVISKLKSLHSQEDKDKLETVKRKLSGLIGYRNSQKLIEEYTLRSQSIDDDFDGSQYSLFNYLTSKAKTYDIYRRTQLEQIVGDIFLS